MAVLCAGGAVVDRKFHLHSAAVAATSNPARQVPETHGGVARNVAEGLARLGVPAALLTRVGDDAAGRGLLDRLVAVGVGVDDVAVVPGGVTAQYVAVLDPAGELVLGVAAMDLLDGIRPGDLDAAAARRPAWIFLDCNLPAPVIDHALRLARRDGMRVAVDAVSTAKVLRLPTDLRGVTVLFCNTAEARAWAATADADAGAPPGEVIAAGDAGEAGEHSSASDVALARRLRRGGAAAVVLTRGPDALLVADATGVREVPAVPARVVDVTGAGDALVAGTLAALFRGDAADGDDGTPPPGAPTPGQDEGTPQPGALTTAVAFGARLAALTVASEHTVVPDLPRDLTPTTPGDHARRPREAPARRPSTEALARRPPTEEYP